MGIDPIGDMIARVRNAQLRQKSEVRLPASRLKAAILDALVREGYVRAYHIEKEPGCPQDSLRIELKYFNGRPVIQMMKRISKPSFQVYTPLKKMSAVSNGLGNAILSTSLGVLSDREAKARGVGGQVLLTVR